MFVVIKLGFNGRSTAVWGMSAIPSAFLCILGVLLIFCDHLGKMERRRRLEAELIRRSPVG